MQRTQDPGSRNKDPGLRIQVEDPGSKLRIQDPSWGSRIQVADPESRQKNIPVCWIPNSTKLLKTRETRVPNVFSLYFLFFTLAIRNCCGTYQSNWHERVELNKCSNYKTRMFLLMELTNNVANIFHKIIKLCCKQTNHAAYETVKWQRFLFTEKTLPSNSFNADAKPIGLFRN